MTYNITRKNRHNCSLICTQNACGHILREVVDFNTTLQRYETKAQWQIKYNVCNYIFC